MEATTAQIGSAASRASGSSFYTAMRILPRAQRDAMFEIYSFCRAVDDIADDGGPQPARSAALAQWRRNIEALCSGKTAPAGLEGLGEAIRGFDLAREDFDAVIDGMEMDVVADIQAPDDQTLELYCDRVASAVGRLSVRIFGVPRSEGKSLAHHLGRAFQLTNILRDLDEDAEIERLYLPREALLAAGIAATAPRPVLDHPALAKACAPIIARAKDHFARADEIMRRCPRASVRAPRLMGDVYRAILKGVEARGFAPPRTKVRVPKHRVLLAFLRHGLF
ncbi:presqualene diphosphate synthase HpnD [Methylovirgula sp. HY1]|uniref:presqualene diphosphate synthase HpnD n=1 Tax=Methylovirgula sp. HY1 TaxID=2822761 RepID=UPI001C75F93D|nr:All-trans-phytoene synthase [Methylovirgula sp. HY1]